MEYSRRIDAQSSPQDKGEIDAGASPEGIRDGLSTAKRVEAGELGSTDRMTDTAHSAVHDLHPACRTVQTYEDILPAYRGTAVEDLLTYHNLGVPFREHSKPDLLIGMCMDYRMWLRIPPDFAYLLRVGGANLRGLQFYISLAVAVGGVSAICLVAHDDCACARLTERHVFVRALVESGGWNSRDARRHFDAHAPHVEIGDPIAFVRSEALRLSQRYPRTLVAPLFYSVEDRAVYQIDLDT
jgi:carbonic anhydrase